MPLPLGGGEGRVRGRLHKTRQPRRYTRRTMRILSLTPMLVDVPLRSAVQGVHGTTAVQRSVLVRVTTDDRIEGWGNVASTPGCTLMSAQDITDPVERCST